MKQTRSRLLILVLALLASCALATAALAVSGSIDDDPAAGTGTVQPAEKGYVLREEAVFADDEVPLAAGPVQPRCIVHLALCVPILAVAVFFLYRRHRHRVRRQELLARLRG